MTASKFVVSTIALTLFVLSLLVNDTDLTALARIHRF